jgi:hypothetical protein
MNALEPSHLVTLSVAASGTAGRYLDWGVVHISVANLLIIILMVITFVAALLLPFPGAGEEWGPPSAAREEQGEGR